MDIAKTEIFQTIGNYKILLNKPIGKGAYGEVYPCFPLDRKERLAVKRIFIDKKERNFTEEMNEAKIMKKFNHPNIIKFYEMKLDEAKEYLYIFMELAENGDLGSFITKSSLKTQNENKALIYLAQIVSALDYAASNFKIIHRDIKPANILLDKDKKLKIVDFGFARFMENPLKKEKMTKTIGSIFYMAPEVFLGKPYNLKCDVWSVGIMIYELIFEKAPWEIENSDFEHFINIEINNEIKFEKEKISEDFKDLIKKMLKYNVDKRIGWKEIKKHKVMSNFFPDIFDSSKNIYKIITKMVTFLVDNDTFIIGISFRQTYHLLFFLQKLKLIIMNCYCVKNKNFENENSILKEILKMIKKHDRNYSEIKAFKKIDFLVVKFKEGFKKECLAFLKEILLDEKSQKIEYFEKKKAKKFLDRLIYFRNLEKLEGKEGEVIEKEIKSYYSKSIETIMKEEKII